MLKFCSFRMFRGSVSKVPSNFLCAGAPCSLRTTSLVVYQVRYRPAKSKQDSRKATKGACHCYKSFLQHRTFRSLSMLIQLGYVAQTYVRPKSGYTGQNKSKHGEEFEKPNRNKRHMERCDYGGTQTANGPILHRTVALLARLPLHFTSTDASRDGHECSGSKLATGVTWEISKVFEYNESHRNVEGRALHAVLDYTRRTGGCKLARAHTRGTCKNHPIWE